MADSPLPESRRAPPKSIQQTLLDFSVARTSARERDTVVTPSPEMADTTAILCGRCANPVVSSCRYIRYLIARVTSGRAGALSSSGCEVTNATSRGSSRSSLRGPCFSGHRRTPYAAWSDLVRGFRFDRRSCRRRGITTAVRVPWTLMSCNLVRIDLSAAVPRRSAAALITRPSIVNIATATI